jgi:cell division septation protein DedD
MARTNRDEALAAQDAAAAVAQQHQQANASVETLDDLNLDDMFDGNDNFFDGLDIDLDGIGGIAHSNRRSSSGSTALEPSSHFQQDNDAMRFDSLLGGSEEQALPGSTAALLANAGQPSRRTTKRTIKSTSRGLYDDGDEDFDLSKKRKRSTNVAAGKKKQGAAKSTAATKKTQASKKKGTKIKATSSQSSLATSFDERSTGRGNASDTSSSKGKKMKRTVSSASSQGAAGNPSCGLSPSTTFYPFMPTIPTEPSLKKSSRLFSVLNPVYSASIAPAMSNAPPTNIPETDAIYKLLLTDDQPPAAGSAGVNLEARHRALSSAIQQARNTVSNANKARLVSDLQALSLLVKRQFEFLNQSLDNMERWSRSKFSEKDQIAVYGTGGNKGKSSGDSGPGFAMFRTPILKVKIKCSGFKPPKQSQLLAKLPLSQTPYAAVATKTEKSAKKRRASPTTSATSADTKPASAPVGKPDEAAVVPYAKLEPWQRRHRITEAMAQRAYQLDMRHSERVEKRRKRLQRRDLELKKIVEDDLTHLPNTSALWKWIEKSDYFAEYSNEDIDDVLQDLWESEIDEEDVLPPRPKTWPQDSSLKKKSAETMLFRLQSLLVDVGSDSEDDEGEEEYAVDPWDSKGIESSTRVTFDMSDFTLEERAYIHLRAAGVVKDDLPLQVFEREGRGIEDQTSKTLEDKRNDIDEVIQLMQTSLAGQVRTNNERVAFLDSTARAHAAELAVEKRKREKETLLIAKYNQLVKKQKDSKRTTARQKTTKKDEDWVPW